MTDNAPAGAKPKRRRRRAASANLPSDRIPIRGSDPVPTLMETANLARVGILGSIDPALSAAMGGRFERMAADLRESSEKLRLAIAETERPAFVPGLNRELADLARTSLGPSQEARATHAVRDEVSRLAEITAAMGDQVAAIVELGAELRTALLDSAAASRRAADVQIWLNRILVALTVVLTGLTLVLAFRSP